MNRQEQCTYMLAGLISKNTPVSDAIESVKIAVELVDTLNEYLSSNPDPKPKQKETKQ